MSVAASHTERSSPDPIVSVFDQYYTRLCYFAFKLVHDKEVAKDIVQDVFLKCWKSIPEVGEEAATRNFLYLSVRNASLNHLRHEGVEKRYSESQKNENQYDESGILEQLIRAEVLAEIRTAIEALPEGCRHVLKLGFFEGLKNEEIAQQLNISIHTVKSQKQRALKLLRLKLDLYSFLLLSFFLGDS
jgi:RNA polymerase sigma-70 factor (ECF subfamily)